MLKIGTACGSGLGSSFMVQMNIESVLSDLNVSDVEVEHYDLGGADQMQLIFGLLVVI